MLLQLTVEEGRDGVTDVKLRGAAEGYELYVYTMGAKRYAEEMVRLIDHDGALGLAGSDRVIGKEDGMHARHKSLDVVLGSEETIVIVDDSKIVDGLGPSFALPVEIAPFCWEHTMRTVCIRVLLSLVARAGRAALLSWLVVGTGYARGGGAHVTGTGAGFSLSRNCTTC